MSTYNRQEDVIDWSDDDDRLFDSPVATKASTKNHTNETPQGLKARQEESRYDAEETRENTLQQELENVRKINQVIEGVVGSLEKAKGNMNTVSKTVNSASLLLQSWTRILSQTEHNQRLILHPGWQGATQDVANIEVEEAQRQRDAQRRQFEDQQRRELAARKAEEEERRRVEAAARGTRGSRGKSRGTGRASSTMGTSSSGYGLRGSTNRGSSSSSRGNSTIGRGLRGTGRTRG